MHIIFKDTKIFEILRTRMNVHDNPSLINPRPLFSLVTKNH